MTTGLDSAGVTTKRHARTRFRHATVEPVKVIGVNDYDTRAGFVKSPHLISIGRFHVKPAHFVERHGLLMLMAFGESVVAIGIGAAGLPLDAGVIAGFFHAHIPMLLGVVFIATEVIRHAGP